MSYFKQHKYHLIAFAVLLIVTGVSGYHVFTTHDTLNTTPDKIQNTWNNIQGDTEKEISNTVIEELDINIEEETGNKENLITQISDPTLNSDNQTPDDAMEIINNEIIKPITNDQSPITLNVAGEEYNTEFKEGMTVYELMQILSASSIKPFMFSGQDYGTSMGYFVTEINRIKNDPQTGKYWIYYINDESAKTGISNYIINKGDIIEWKYETTNF